MYYPSGKKFSSYLCNVVAILAVIGCQAHRSIAATQASLQPLTGTTAAQHSSTQQLIIKFKLNAFACNAAGIEQLSSATRVMLEFIRPMSGDACVIKQLDESSIDLLRGQERLRQHPAVEWLELDARKKAL